MFRIQMSTQALSSIVPGGSAAGSALGYRLMTLSGIRGTDAGFALGTVGLGSAVMLNLIFWIGLIISIPIRGVNPDLRLASPSSGIIVMGFAAALVFGLMEGAGRAERTIRWVARRFHVDDERAARVLAPGRRAPRGARQGPAAARAGRCSGPRSTGCSTRPRCGCSSAPSGRASTSTRSSSRSGSPTCSPRSRSRRAGSASSTPATSGCSSASVDPAPAGDARRGLVPVRAVLLPDPARRDPVPDAARRAVEHRAA